MVPFRKLNALSGLNGRNLFARAVHAYPFLPDPGRRNNPIVSLVSHNRERMRGVVTDLELWKIAGIVIRVWRWNTANEPNRRVLRIIVAEPSASNCQPQSRNDPFRFHSRQLVVGSGLGAAETAPGRCAVTWSEESISACKGLRRSLASSASVRRNASTP